MAQFQAAADPLCRFCSQGIVTRIERNGKRVFSGCQCAARKLRREMRVARQAMSIPTAPFVHVEKDPALEGARLDARLGILRAQAEAIEASVRERTQGCDDAVVGAKAMVQFGEAECSDSRLRVMDEETTLLLAKQEAAEKIGNQKRKLAEERELLARREKAKAQAAATLSELQSKRARISKDTEGARKRAENLRRRIAGIEARNADALKDGEPC